jgi:hypothetical protein
MLQTSDSPTATARITKEEQMQNDPITIFSNMLTAIDNDPNDQRHSFHGPMMALPNFAQPRQPPHSEDGPRKGKGEES